MFRVCVFGRGGEVRMYIRTDMKELLITVDSCNEEELGRPIVHFTTVVLLSADSVGSSHSHLCWAAAVGASDSFGL